MCLIVLEIDDDPMGGILIAANRDEYYERPTLPAGRWGVGVDIVAGRDLVGGGTWLGITQGGRFAAVTNFRDPSAKRGSRTRGELVTSFLLSEVSAAEYLEGVAAAKNEYSGFNLIVGSTSRAGVTAAYFSNQDGKMRILEPGLYGLSNHLLDTPWPKVRRAKELFLGAKGDGDEGLFAMLSDRTAAPDDELPDTGIGRERERLLSPIFIESPNYGTRCSTVVRVNAHSSPSLIERVHV
jgi:uncharacterized protein with NRDE domain